MFGFGRLAGVPVPVIVAVIIAALTWVLVNRTALGRYFYAVGGNVKAAHLSGINTRLHAVSHLYAVRVSERGVRHAADRAAGDGRGQHRRIPCRSSPSRLA